MTEYTKTNEVGLPSIDVNNVQEIIVNGIISLSISLLLFSVFFFILILISKRFLVFKTNILYKKALAYILLGFLSSFTSIFLYIVGRAVYSQYIILSQLFVFFLFGLFTSSFLMVGIFPGFVGINLYYYFVFDQSTTQTYQLIFMMIFFVLISVLVFVSRFIYENKFIYIFLSVVFLFLLMTLLAYLMFDYDIFLSIGILEAINFIIFIALFIVATYILNIIDNTYQLKTSIKYDNNIFVNSGYSEIAFKEFVKKNNVNFGLFLTFDFKNIEMILKEKGNKTLLEIQKNFIKNIYFYFGEECFYFKTKVNEYGLFFKIDKKDITLKKSIYNNKNISRSNDDFLKQYEIVLNRFPKKINIENEEYDISIACYGSIYGIHSNQYNKLESYNQIQKKKNHEIKTNIISLFDIKNNLTLNDNEFKKIKNKYLFDKAILNLEKLNFKYNKHPILKNNLIWIPYNVLNYEDFLKMDLKEKELNYISRHFAYKFLSLIQQYIQNTNYKNELFWLDYPIDYVCSKEFDIDKFIKVFKLFNIQPKTIILNFDMFNFKKKEFDKISIKNLNDLKNSKFKLSFANCKKDKFIDELNKIDNKNQFLFVEKEIIKN